MCFALQSYCLLTGLITVFSTIQEGMTFEETVQNSLCVQEHFAPLTNLFVPVCEGFHRHVWESCESVNFWTPTISLSSRPTGGSADEDCSVSAVLSDMQAPHCCPEITAVEEVWLTGSSPRCTQENQEEDLQWLLQLVFSSPFSPVRAQVYHTVKK